MATDWKKIRALYPATEKYTYFNTASCGLMSTQAIDHNKTFHSLLANQGSVYRDTQPTEMQKVKETVGAFINTEAKDIALIPNFSNGINYVVPMLKSLGSVLLVENDYPSLTLPWQLHNFDIHWMPQSPQGVIDLDQIAKALKTHHIKILAISYVQYATGFKIPLESLSKICAENNTLLVVDATQALGVVPIDLKNTQVDILISSCYKWTTAGFGNGILYLHPSIIEQFETPVIGKNSTGLFPGIYNADAIGLQARTFEVGHYNYAAFLILDYVMNELQRIGQQNIYDHVLELARYFKERVPQQYTLISDYTSEQSTGIVSIKGGSTKLMEELVKENIVVSARGEGMRVSMHFYNTFEEIDHLLRVLEAH